MTSANRRVKRRRVFHIPGYDPMHPRRYRELYRKEGAAQARISGYTLSLKAAPSETTFRWAVRAQIEGQEVTTLFDVLVWSDIVRDSMAQSIPATYLQLLQTAWIYLFTGTLRRLMWMRKGPVIAALYPVAMLLAQLGLALLAGSLVSGLLQRGLDWLTGDSFLAAVVPWIAWAVFFAVVVLVLRQFKALDNRLFAYYLMHDYAFSARLNGANPPQLEARMAEFRQVIKDALAEDVDEVLVVGHSSGAHLAVSILADILRDGDRPADGPNLAFLSLGQVVPMVSFLPRAKRLRRDLAYLSTARDLAWVDVSAPADGACFALCDPVAVTGVAPADKMWPLVLSAAYSKTLSPAQWKSMRWRFFRLHFQYLCAFERPNSYDYFQITAGPRLLIDRFAGRSPSASRIDVPVSKYTSMAP
ncbi:MAG: hypothetical protein ACSHW1_13060 [Yoonia sp.]|uniref:hypothetical protein n=1 Tax=Yoonia sp. TaxID=2212373 RepID=UPI003EF0E267